MKFYILFFVWVTFCAIARERDSSLRDWQKPREWPAEDKLTMLQQFNQWSHADIGIRSWAYKTLRAGATHTELCQVTREQYPA